MRVAVRVVNRREPGAFIGFIFSPNALPLIEIVRAAPIRVYFNLSA